MRGLAWHRHRPDPITFSIDNGCLGAQATAAMHSIGLPVVDGEGCKDDMALIRLSLLMSLERTDWSISDAKLISPLTLRLS